MKIFVKLFKKNKKIQKNVKKIKNLSTFFKKLKT
jgi:hypothetical protein